MLAVLVCLLDQRLSVETARVEHCAKVKNASAPGANASNIIAVVAADGSICYVYPLSRFWVMNPRIP